MKDERAYISRRMQQDTVHIRAEKGFLHTFFCQIFISILLAIALCVVRFMPEGDVTPVKNTVKLILNQHTDLKEEAEKIKRIFVEDEATETLSPVANFVNPAPGGVISAGFGVQNADNDSFHYGVDISLSQGESVLAASDGEVTEIATNETLGSYIVIKHSKEVFTTYAHLGEILPDVGEKVKAGRPVARSDNRAIYFEIKCRDTYLDPAEFIDFGGADG